MKKEKLIALDKKLDATLLSSQILIDKRGYYFYYNEPNKRDKPLLIHKYFCGECAWGSGKRKKKELGKKGVWIGPFAEINYAVEFIKGNFPPDIAKLVKNCPDCIKKLNQKQ